MQCWTRLPSSHSLPVTLPDTLHFRISSGSGVRWKIILPQGVFVSISHPFVPRQVTVNGLEVVTGSRYFYRGKSTKLEGNEERLVVS